MIVSFHWGIEYQSQAAGYQRTLVHECVDAGADLVLGSHPHVLQGIEVYKNKLIAYGLGDFVSDHRPGITGQSIVLRVTLTPSGPPVARIIPVYLSDTYGIPAPVTRQRSRYDPQPAHHAERRLRHHPHPLGRHGLGGTAAIA